MKQNRSSFSCFCLRSFNRILVHSLKAPVKSSIFSTQNIRYKWSITIRKCLKYTCVVLLNQGKRMWILLQHHMLKDLYFLGLVLRNVFHSVLAGILLWWNDSYWLREHHRHISKLPALHNIIITLWSNVCLLWAGCERALVHGCGVSRTPRGPVVVLLVLDL